MELKKRPTDFSFYLIDEINEKTYQQLKKEITDKINELNDIDEHNHQVCKTLGIENYLLKTPIDIYLYISTYGGYVYDGLGICDLIHDIDNNEKFNLLVICQGKIMSMGIPIVLSAKNRVCTKHTSFMIHEIASGTYGKLNKLKESVEETSRLGDIVDEIIIRNSNITKEELNDIYTHKRDYYFDAYKALKKGIINSVIE